MKKIFFSVLAVTMLSATTYSQSVHFGVKAGANLANLTYSYDDESESEDAKIGLQAGAFATIMISDKFGIQPEVLYSMEGSQFDIDGSDEKVKTNLSYLQVPVLLRFQPVSVLNIHAGPQFGFKIASKYTYDGESEDLEGAQSTVVGFAAGAGINATERLEIGARYSASLSDIADDDDDDSKASSRVLQVFLAFRIK